MTSRASSAVGSTTPARGRRQSNAEGYKPRLSRTTGSKPACLVNASVTYCGDDQIYAFGGFDQFTDEVYNHVLRLDLKTLNWSLVDNYGDIPGVRMGHSASLYKGDKLLVYGGENEHREYLSDIVILNLKTFHWIQPDVRGPVPKGRARHSAVIYEDKLFIIGGLSGEANTILDDICYLDLKTWTWSKTWSFIPRFDHSTWVHGSRLFLFGGLGPEMERSTEIWWLDLKGSSTFVTDPSIRRVASSSATAQNSSITSGPSTYAANSGSVHVRSSRKEKPTAPGAISSLKFISGAKVPSQSSGTHFLVCSSGALLDFVTPATTIHPRECNLSCLELDSLRWERLVEGPDLFDPAYRWHYCTVNENGTKAWLLGSVLEGVAPNGQDTQLSEVLAIDLRKYGLLGNDVPQPHADVQGLSSTPSIGLDLATMFDQSPESGSMTDFIITANTDDSPPLDAESNTRMSMASMTSEVDSGAAATPIHVHKMILQARWPHFRRLYNAKMAEYHEQKLHIPEPYSVVRAFLYYLYTDSIAPHSVYCSDLTDVAGMLVMANLYDMPKLRLLCVHRLSREIDINHAAIVWERAGRTDEEWLKQRAARYCLANWGRIVRTPGFRSLPRQSILELCEVGDQDARVQTGDDYGDGACGFSDTASARRRTGETEENDEDEDGMEIN